MEVEQMQTAVLKIKNGLSKYLYIMERLNKTDVSQDEDFQRCFNGFYRMRQRSKLYYTEYFNLLEKHKAESVSFDYILDILYQKTGRIEASFASKMLATINDDMPILDSLVLKNLNMSLPYYSDKNRMKKISKVYIEICKWYEDFLKTEVSKLAIKIFDESYPESKISDVKKIDFILWQIREE